MTSPPHTLATPPQTGQTGTDQHPTGRGAAMTLQTRHDTPGSTTPPGHHRRNTRMILAWVATLTLLAVAAGFAIHAATNHTKYVDPYAAQRAAKITKNSADARQALARYDTAINKAGKQGNLRGIDLTAVASDEELTNLQALYSSASLQQGQRIVGSVRSTIQHSEYVTVSPTHYQVEYSVCYDRTGVRYFDRLGHPVKPLGPDGTPQTFETRSLSRVVVDGSTTSTPKVIQSDHFLGTC